MVVLDVIRQCVRPEPNAVRHEVKARYVRFSEVIGKEMCGGEANAIPEVRNDSFFVRLWRIAYERVEQTPLIA
jgi:hypothetical protein